jgi:hypothetical protein
MSLLTLSRWQFAITVTFHMTFPAITVGTLLLLCVLYGMHWRTGKPVYLEMFRFWRRLAGPEPVRAVRLRQPGEKNDALSSSTTIRGEGDAVGGANPGAAPGWR